MRGLGSAQSSRAWLWAGAFALALAGCGGAESDADSQAQARKQGLAAGGSADVGGGGGTSYTGETLYSEAGKLIRGDESLVALGNELFGDRVGLFTGSLEFVQTDVSIPGNSGLPVAVGRRHTAPVFQVTEQGQRLTGAFGDWDLEIPRLHGVFGNAGWTVSGSQPQKRCTNFGAPPPVAVSQGTIGSFSAQEYWHGHSIYVPGSGSQEILVRNGGQTATDGNSYPLTTKDRWMIRCLPTLAYGSGEGFLAVSPDGTQYRFDRMISRPYGRLVKSSPSPGSRNTGGARSVKAPVDPAPNYMAGGFMMNRKEVWILPSQVIDRHGNTVTYSYDPAYPERLLSIEGSDAAGSPRLITLGYNTDGLVTTVTTVIAGVSRTWTYAYRASTLNVGYVLASLTLPDNSAWTFNIDNLTYREFPLMAEGSGGCGGINYLDTGPLTGTMTHPSGATGSFTVKGTSHGRSHVDYYCANMQDGDPQSGIDYYPRFIDRYSISNKTISGPGMTPKTWAYAYGPANASFAPCNGCPETKTVTVTDPEDGQTRYTFGIRFNVNEGQLLKTEEGWNGSAALKTTTRAYAAPGTGSWPDPVGQSLQPRGNGYLASRHAPENLKVISQQAATFSWQANTFDQFAKPTDVTRGSSLGWSRRDITVFNNNFTKWVLSQPQTVTDYATNTVAEQNTYDPSTANRTAKYAFGRLIETNTYNADGTVYTRTDALNHTTTLTNYKRGLARNASYADSTSESASINDDGTISSVTNAAGTTTSYGYDAKGRLSSITYPGGDPVAYVPTTFTYAQVGALEYGVAPGHWRLTKATGNALSTTYFDAQWRPVMTRTWDGLNETSTRRVKIIRYDSGGRKTFESYPQRDIRSIADSVTGTTTSYDALGRPTLQVASSELNNLTTTTDYLSGFQRRTTNARGYQTTHAFQAFDEPKEDGITNIWAPEGVSVTISRDGFGKATAITRAGGGKSVTRSYVYDGYQRLCKTIEPETGATVVDYHGQSELKAWSASGQAFPSTSACDQGSVPLAKQVSYGYDLRNRLETTTYGPGGQTVTRKYTPDGLLLQIVASHPVNPITWNYLYNNRRMLVREGFTWWPGVAVNTWDGWNFDYDIDARGNVGGVSDPWGSMGHVPNALGEPTMVAGYLSNITYHPTGALDGYTAAGVNRSTTLNARGLPSSISYSGVSQDVYTYDANGNVTGINTTESGAGASNYVRSMPLYDGLDRLRQANGPWGSGTFDYDALDNLTASALAGAGGVPPRSLTHNINPTTNRLDGLTGSQSIVIGYDANGNVSQRGAQQFGFDIGNRMTTGPGNTTYIYDGHGRRSMARFANGDLMLQAYTTDGKQRFSYRTSDGGHVRHVYLGDKVVAESSEGNIKTFLHTDALGSPIARTNDTGGVISRTRYEPYGATVSGTTNPTRIGFTGHVNDADSGLVYMQQRYYEPISGRFLSVDPVVTTAKDGSFFGRYQYANNNPYKFKDPDGRAGISANIPYEEGGPSAGTRGIGDVVNLGKAEGAATAAAQHIGAPVMAAGAGLFAGAVGGGKASGGSSTGSSAGAGGTPAPAGGPNFIVTPGGTAFPVPTGATGPTPVVGGGKAGVTGAAFTGGSGGDKKLPVTTMRIMNPNAQNPSGYIKYENSAGQGVNPSGATVQPKAAHIPIDR